MADEADRGLDAALAELIGAAADRAEAELDVLMPGYTHVQPAQPVRWSHWLLSHTWPWQRDRARLADCGARQCAAPRSGRAGRLSVPDRPRRAGRRPRFCRSARTAWTRSATATSWPSSSSGPRCPGVHLSRWAEDLILWSSREFGFVTLADAYSTGSSLMPQKKNPDALELLRGKSGRLVGQLTGTADDAQGAAERLQ